MPKSVIVDTSCFIVLSKIGKIDLLDQLYPIVQTTPEVVDEYKGNLPKWIKVQSTRDNLRQQRLEVDKGEASVIAYALEHPDKTLILDDGKGRDLAKTLNLTFTGTIGVIVKAKQRNIIPSVRPFLKSIKETDFHISDQVLKKALILANE